MKHEETTALLDELATLPPPERAQRLRATSGDVDSLLIALGDEAEKLVVVEIARARTAAELVVALADGVGAPAARARARRALGQALAYSGELEAALEACRDAVEIAERAGETVQAARARLASIHALGELGRYDEAIETGERAYAMLFEAGEPALAARADLNLGVIHRKAGRARKAVMHFDRAAPHFRDQPGILAQLQSNRGEALLDLDELRGAAEAFDDALSLFKSLDHGWGAAIVEGNLADLSTRQGHLDRALRHFEQARRHVELDRSPTHHARLLVELGDAKSAMGMLDDAEADYRSALPVLDEHQQAAEAARARAGLAGVLLRLGRIDDAEDALREAITEYAALGQRRAVARLNLVRCDLLRQRGRLDLARASAEEALRDLREWPLDAAVAQYRLASIALAEKRMDDAERLLAQAMRAAEASGVAPLIADLLHLEGCIRLKQGDSAAAIDSFRRAVAHVERVRGALQADRFRAAFLGDHLALYEDLTGALLQQGDAPSIAEAFRAAEMGRSRSLLDVVRGAIDLTTPGAAAASADSAQERLLEQVNDAQERLNALYARTEETGGSVGVTTSNGGTWREEVASLETLLASLEARLSATQGVGGLYTTPASLDEVQQAIGDDAVLIEYAAADNHLHAFIVTRTAVHVARSICSLDGLAEQVKRFHFQLGRALRPNAFDGNRGERLLNDARRELGALHDMVIEPLVDAIGSPKRIVVVPHGPLHTIPFAALWDGDAHLLEQAEIITAVSASLFVHQSRIAGRRHSMNDRTAAVVCVADELAPRLEDEARAVARVLAAKRYLEGENATVDAVMHAAEGASVLHIACHGRFDAANPLGSGVRLADRWMTVRDFYRLSLEGALVVLSGCETGRSSIGRGDEITGVVRALLAGGARAAIVSLWLTGDNVTNALVKRFYEIYHGDSAGEQGMPAAALRQAQLEAMASHPHPVFWAPFQMVGP